MLKKPAGIDINRALTLAAGAWYKTDSAASFERRFLE
jgi:hypothetical protein